jgi:hypothetical protein
MTVMGLKSGLLFILRTHMDLMIARTQVQFREKCRASQFI